MAKVSFIYRGKKESGKLSIRFINGSIHDYRVSTPILSKKEYWFHRTTKDGKTKIRHLQLDKFSNHNKTEESKNHKKFLEKVQTQLIDLFISDNNKGLPITKDWLKESILSICNILDSKEEITKEDEKLQVIEREKKEKEEHIKNANLLSNAIKKMFIKYQTNPDELKKYKVTLNFLKKFEKYEGKEFRTKELNQEFADRFCNWAHLEMMYQKSYINAQLKRLRSSVIKSYESDEEDIVEVSKTLRSFTMFKNVYKDKVVVTLNYDELDKIDDTVINNPKLNDAKKSILIGCETGLRYSDQNKLIDTNIKNINGVNYWKFRTEKTDTIVQIIITDRILYLIEKYGLPETNYPSNGVKLNKDIKEVCKLCGINEKIKGSLATKTSINNKSVIRNTKDYYEKYKLIRTRTFRRSFATNYYGKIDTSLITAITGHSTEKQLRAYINNNDESNIIRTKQQIDRFHEERKQEKNNIKLTVIPKASNQN